MSDETLKIRRNTMVLAGACIFMGWTGQLPSQFGILGLKFAPSQQSSMGIFVLSVLAYFLIHFVVVAQLEFYELYKDRLTRSFHGKAYDEIMSRDMEKENQNRAQYDDAEDIHYSFIRNDTEDYHKNEDLKQFGAKTEAELIEQAHTEASWMADRKLRHFDYIFYFRLIIDFAAPVVLGIYGLIQIASLT